MFVLLLIQFDLDLGFCPAVMVFRRLSKEQKHAATTALWTGFDREGLA